MCCLRNNDLENKKIGKPLAVGLVLAGGVIIACTVRDRQPKSSPENITAAPVHLPGGWGYKIELNHHLYIYQNQVPCLPGNQLFPTRESAMAIAGLVVEKIKHGQLPTVSKDDLKRLTAIRVP